MPAPRAVLSDIIKYGLRADKPISLVRADGSLRPFTPEQNQNVAVEEVVEEPTVQPEPVAEPEQPALSEPELEETVEPVKSDEPIVESSTEEMSVVEGPEDDPAEEKPVEEVTTKHRRRGRKKSTQSS